ncbi:hypothetical protein [Enterocloster asparagiformis]|nr:hypothetical protein [Enterocloster asparagiformis]RGX24632.1 hypothetical protein DWV29_22990 [Enterocloster asparagiformis]
MKKMMRKTGFGGALLIILASALLAGCGKEADDRENYRKIVDDYAVFTLEQDGDSAAYDRALEAVGSYLENDSGDSLENARKVVSDTLEQMESDADKAVSYELSEELAAVLAEYGVDQEEYAINANMRAAYLSDYIESLKTLRYYLEPESKAERDLLRDDLEFLYGFQRDSQTSEKGFYYYSINYWFAGWDGDQKAYVEEKVIKNLKSYEAENPVWEDSRDAVEQKMNLYLDQMEELQYRLEEHIGRSQEDLYQMELPSE